MFLYNEIFFIYFNKNIFKLHNIIDYQKILQNGRYLISKQFIQINIYEI